MTLITLRHAGKRVQAELLNPVHAIDQEGHLYGLMRTNTAQHQWFEHSPPPMRIWEETGRQEVEEDGGRITFDE